MKRMNRSRLQRVVTTALALVMVFMMVLPTEAATNKALCIKTNFNGMNYEKNGDKYSYNNSYMSVFYDTQKAATVSKLKLSGVTYIPKKILDKKNATATVNMYIDIDKKNEYYGSVIGRYNITAVKEGKKIKLYAWDEQMQKNVKVPKTVSIKAGKGAYKQYYILTLKNMPLCNKIVFDNGKSRKLKAKDAFKYRVASTIAVENYKGKADIYLDNIVVTSAAKKLVNIDFNKKVNVDVINRDKVMSHKNYGIKKF